ncbi:MAG: hypothetical protein GF370_02190 [Candidatus Nealsonbacteria bacterium]|nr:hypothetical protein [Candidatus Nealsonbacteria bacterium]
MKENSKKNDNKLFIVIGLLLIITTNMGLVSLLIEKGKQQEGDPSLSYLFPALFIPLWVELGMKKEGLKRKNVLLGLALVTLIMAAASFIMVIS